MVNFLIMAVQQNVTLFHCFQWSFQWSSGHLHDIRNSSWVSQDKVAEFLTKQQLKSISQNSLPVHSVRKEEIWTRAVSYCCPCRTNHKILKLCSSAVLGVIWERFQNKRDTTVNCTTVNCIHGISTEPIDSRQKGGQIPSSRNTLS